MHEQEKIKDEAENYARLYKNKIAKEATNLSIYPAEENPVSVFMAGSPGAGKTESSKNLILKFSKENQSILRIDPDELRHIFEKYTGDNSFLFHGAVSILVDRIHDLALKNKQSFVFDGTFSKYDKAVSNIQRSLSRGRFVQILYVYQNPLQAWNFVQERERKEGRKIKKEDFITQYFQARETVQKVKENFGRGIQVDLLVKNIDGSDQFYKENVDSIDNHIEEKYTKEALQTLL